MAGTKARGRRFETRDSDATNGIQVTLDYSSHELGSTVLHLTQTVDRPIKIRGINVGQPALYKSSCLRAPAESSWSTPYSSGIKPQQVRTREET